MKYRETTLQQYNFSAIKRGNISTPRGFTAGGMHTDLRANEKDFGRIYSPSLAGAATVYTLNQFKVVPLIVTEDTSQKSKGKLQALVVNSANANSCIGQQGVDDARQTQTQVAQQPQIPSEHTAVALIGVIGEYLPMDKIKTGTKHIKDTNFATPGMSNKVILTADTYTKHIVVPLKIDGKTVIIDGSAKGSGMIHPDMTTMLAFITTGASIESNMLHQLLESSTGHTFNIITVDDDTSTSDMVLIMTNRQIEYQILSQDHPQWETFVGTFNFVYTFLAKAIVRDGEGAMKLISVNASSAKSVSDAGKVGEAIVSPNLVKLATFGEDANFGRIIIAIGYSGYEIDPNCTYVRLNQIPVADKGMAVLFDEQAVPNILTHGNVATDVQLGLDSATATAYGYGLPYDYVRINASYRV